MARVAKPRAGEAMVTKRPMLTAAKGRRRLKRDREREGEDLSGGEAKEREQKERERRVVRVLAVASLEKWVAISLKP